MSWTAAGPEPALPDTALAFLGHLDVEKGYSPATVEAYGRALEQFEDFLAARGAGLHDPAALTRDHVRGFMADLHPQRHRQSLRGPQALHPALVLQIPRPRRARRRRSHRRSAQPKQDARHPRALNVDQALALMEAQTGEDPESLRDVALAELLYGSGLRISEALDLDVDDFDPGSGVVRVMARAPRSAWPRSPKPGASAWPSTCACVASSPPAWPKRRCFWAYAGRACSAARPAASSTSSPPWPGCPRASTRTCCATASPPTCWNPAPTCAASRNCWAMPV